MTVNMPNLEYMFGKIYSLKVLQKALKEGYVFDETVSVETNYGYGSSLFRHPDTKVVTEIRKDFKFSRKNLGFHLKLKGVSRSSFVKLIPKKTYVSVGVQTSILT